MLAISETSETGTSHQDSYPGTRISLSTSTTTTVVRSCPRMASNACSTSSRVVARTACAPRPAAELKKVPRQVLAIQLPRLRGTVSVVGAEPPRTYGFRQPADAAEPVVVQDQDVVFVTFLDGGDDLRRHNEVRRVAHHDIDVARRVGHLGSQPAGDLVTHTGVAILHVVAAGTPRAP